MKTRHPLDPQAIDALCGLEPVLEPAGAFSYVEDCQVCCQPIELAGGTDEDGVLAGLTANLAG